MLQCLRLGLSPSHEEFWARIREIQRHHDPLKDASIPAVDALLEHVALCLPVPDLLRFHTPEWKPLWFAMFGALMAYRWNGKWKESGTHPEVECLLHTSRLATSAVHATSLAAIPPPIPNELTPRGWPIHLTRLARIFGPPKAAWLLRMRPVGTRIHMYPTRVPGHVFAAFMNDEEYAETRRVVRAKGDPKKGGTEKQDDFTFPRHVPFVGQPPHPPTLLDGFLFSETTKRVMLADSVAEIPHGQQGVAIREFLAAGASLESTAAALHADVSYVRREAKKLREEH